VRAIARSRDAVRLREIHAYSGVVPGVGDAKDVTWKWAARRRIEVELCRRRARDHGSKEKQRNDDGKCAAERRHRRSPPARDVHRSRLIVEKRRRDSTRRGAVSNASEAVRALDQAAAREARGGEP